MTIFSKKNKIKQLKKIADLEYWTIKDTVIYTSLLINIIFFSRKDLL